MDTLIVAISWRPSWHCGGNHQASPGQGHEWSKDGERFWCPGDARPRFPEEATS